MVIADRAAIGLATIQSDVSVYYGAYAFVGMLLYAIDLYADFTGGIDITIGVAQMFGITIFLKYPHRILSKPYCILIHEKAWLSSRLFYRSFHLLIGPCTSCGKKDTNNMVLREFCGDILRRW